MIRKISSLLVGYLLIFCIIKALILLLPGDPINLLLEETGLHIEHAQLAHQLLLDQGYFPRVINSLLLAAQGDWGTSILTGKRVVPLVLSSFAVTAKLTFFTLLFALPLSLFFGIASNGPQNVKLSRLCNSMVTSLGAITAATPSVWIFPVLLYLFSVKFAIFSVQGDFVLAAMSLAALLVGFWSRLIRARVRETLFIGSSIGARARGVSEWKILLKYGFWPASPALVSYFALQTGELLAGAFVAEVVFGLNGLGTIMIEAVLSRDFPVIEAALFLTTSMIITATTFGDLLQYRIDPRSEAL